MIDAGMDGPLVLYSICGCGGGEEMIITLFFGDLLEQFNIVLGNLVKLTSVMLMLLMRCTKDMMRSRPGSSKGQ